MAVTPAKIERNHFMIASRNECNGSSRSVRNESTTRVEEKEVTITGTQRKKSKPSASCICPSDVRQDM
jgi:hypothetical protein